MTKRTFLIYNGKRRNGKYLAKVRCIRKWRELTSPRNARERWNTASEKEWALPTAEKFWREDARRAEPDSPIELWWTSSKANIHRRLRNLPQEKTVSRRVFCHKRNFKALTVWRKKGNRNALRGSVREPFIQQGFFCSKKGRRKIRKLINEAYQKIKGRCKSRINVLTNPKSCAKFIENLVW